jgi:hypothetical protein
MGSIAAEPSALQPPPRYSRVAWGAFVGVIFAALSLWLLDLLVGLAGLVGWEWTTHEPRGPLDLPFRHDGLWSVAANLVVGIGATCFFAACIWDRVERATKRPVSLRLTVLIVLLAGYIPYLLDVRDGFLVVALFVVAFLVRRFAMGAQPTPWPSGARRTVLIVAAAALVVPASYGATHPLWYGTHLFAGAAPQGVDWSAHRVVYSPSRNEMVRVVITIENHARYSVRLLEISGGTDGIRVVGADGGSLPPGSGNRVLPGTVVHPGNEQTVTLLLALRACGREGGLHTLDRVTARYRLFGATLSQPIALAIRPTISCRARG